MYVYVDVMVKQKGDPKIQYEHRFRWVTAPRMGDLFSFPNQDGIEINGYVQQVWWIPLSLTDEHPTVRVTVLIP